MRATHPIAPVSLNTARIRQNLVCGDLLISENWGYLPVLFFFGSGNKLTSVEGLTKCVRLRELSMCNNELTSVRGIPKLAQLDVRQPPPPSFVPPRQHLTTPLHSPRPSKYFRVRTDSST